MVAADRHGNRSGGEDRLELALHQLVRALDVADGKRCVPAVDHPVGLEEIDVPLE